jgi:amino acid permease
MYIRLILSVCILEINCHQAEQFNPVFRRALKSQRISIADLPYRGLFQPYASYLALFFVFLVIIFKGKKTPFYIAKYISSVIWIAQNCLEQATAHLFRTLPWTALS